MCWFVTSQKLQQQGHFKVVAPFSTIWDLVADYREPTLNLSGWIEVLEARLVTDTLSHVFFLSFSPEPAQCVVRVLILTETHVSCEMQKQAELYSPEQPDSYTFYNCPPALCCSPGAHKREHFSLCVCQESKVSSKAKNTSTDVASAKDFLPVGELGLPVATSVFPLALFVIVFPRVTDCQRYSSDVQLILRAYAAHASTHTCARTHRNCCCIIQGQIEGC